MKITETDCLIIGAGAAGSVYALNTARTGTNCVLLSAEKLSVCNSALAQGGIAVEYERHPDLFRGDIQLASGNTSYNMTIDEVLKHGPTTVKEMLVNDLNVSFDRNKEGQLALTREGAHSEDRIIYAKDCTGKVVLEYLHESFNSLPNLERRENCHVIDLLTLSHSSRDLQDKYKPLTCFGAYVLDGKTGVVEAIFAKKTILATGGVGQVYQHSTNTSTAFGAGIAMAYRIGARIMNMEYIQFHPTVFYKKGANPFLVSEAVRGEGGVLINRLGKAFMDEQHPLKSLAPRDIIARSIHREMIKTDSNSVFIDISSKPADYLKKRFPTIYDKCLRQDIDITKDPIPVVPAAHYLCGGIHADMRGRTNIRNLNVIGETACTGLHGANRLASTSLLECVTMGKLASEADLNDLCQKDFYFPDIEDWKSPDEEADLDLIAQDMQLVRNTMWNYVGVIRNEKRLNRAAKLLRELQNQVNDFYAGCRVNKDLLNLRNAVQNALLIVYAASRNKSSRGCHYREE